MQLAVQIWMLVYMDTPALIDKLRKREEALATTEWALLVAGVAALAITVVAVVRTRTNEATDNIKATVNTEQSF